MYLTLDKINLILSYLFDNILVTEIMEIINKRPDCLTSSAVTLTLDPEIGPFGAHHWNTPKVSQMSM